MKRLSLLVLIGLVISAGLSLGQEIFKWTDEKGTVHFADDMSQVPEKYRDQVQTKKIRPEISPEPAPSLPRSSGAPKIAPKPMPGPAKPVSQAPEPKDILGRGEEWWRGQVREWNGKLLDAQKNHEAAAGELKNKVKEIEEAKFKPDSLKRRLKAEMKALEEKVAVSKKQVDDARNMVDKTLPKQAEDYHADPNWLR